MLVLVLVLRLGLGLVLERVLEVAEEDRRRVDTGGADWDRVGDKDTEQKQGWEHRRCTGRRRDVLRRWEVDEPRRNRCMDT